MRIDPSKATVRLIVVTRVCSPPKLRCVMEHIPNRTIVIDSEELWEKILNCSTYRKVPSSAIYPQEATCQTRIKASINVRLRVRGLLQANSMVAPQPLQSVEWCLKRTSQSSMTITKTTIHKGRSTKSSLLRNSNVYARKF